MTYDDMVKEIRDEFEGFQIRKKSDSSLMKSIDVFLRIITFNQMNRFLTKFTTVIGDTVYVTDDWYEKSEISRIVTLRHERVHFRQAKRYTKPLFYILYLFCLPAIWTFRAKFEREAYLESMRATAELAGPEYLNGDMREALVRSFSSASYFWMQPFRSQIEDWFDTNKEMILKELNENWRNHGRTA